jgi:hypothetical protein
VATAIGAEGGAEMTEIEMTAGPTGTTAREVLKRTGIGAEVVTTVPDAARTSGSEAVIRAWACAAIRTSPCEHASTPQRRCWIRRVLWRLSEQAQRPRQVPARDRPPDKRCGEPPLQTPTQPHASRGGAQPESGFVSARSSSRSESDPARQGSASAPSSGRIAVALVERHNSTRARQGR